MKAIKVSGISKAAKALIKDHDDNLVARGFRALDTAERIIQRDFDAKCKKLKGGDLVFVNSKDQTVGYWFEEHAYGVGFKSAKDFAKFVKLCEQDADDEKPAKKEKAEKPAAKKGKQKPVAKKAKAKKADSDDDDEDEPAPKRKKPGKKGEPKAKKADSDDDDNWAGDDADSDDEDDADEKPVKKGKASSKKSDADDEEPDVELDVDDDNSPTENLAACVTALRKELKRLKVKSGNVKDLLELIDGYIEEAGEAGSDDEDEDDAEEEDDSDDE